MGINSNLVRSLINVIKSRIRHKKTCLFLYTDVSFSFSRNKFKYHDWRAGFFMVNNLLNSIENYTEKKRLSQDFQKLMEGRAGLTKSIEIQGCAHVLNFISDKEFEKHRVWRMITCKDPFCPMCAWRK